jgi:DNA (cytosine-5)-methyltransferase 1|uniref:Cytosine specific methyltransferase n=1 Tax=Siphoviridae sp. ctMAv2 TaxID=2826258 RepID=A0A8S5LS85_9CAUD|nr:MAG TPA: Cytosine specific methyltransferase [Siphoviridae sp. ctMAv2]
MENNNLTLGSLFDGSGGFPLGGLISGITPVWASEIEPFPIRVTTKRLPQVKHHGDISKMNGADLEPVDIITFGSPCQDMSIAGKRDGLSGSRSSLFYEAVRIIKEMRCKTDGKYPRFIVWENVPGAFSSNKGEDFRAVLEEVCKIKDESVSVPKPNKWNTAGRILGDGYSVAWRQFDAQFWGVPQRRKRIYLVADFADWCAGKILFESEGLSGYSKTSISSWQGSAATVRESTENAGISLMFENHGQDARYTGPLDVSQTVLSTYGTGGNNQPFIVEDMKSFDVRLTSEGTRNARNNVYETDTSRTIDTGGNSPDSNQGGVAVVAYGICSKDSNSMKSANPKSGFYKANTSRTIDGNGGNPSCNQGGIAVIEGNGTRPSHKGDGYKESDIMYTLNATEQHAVAFADVHATLSANDGPKGPSSQMLGTPEENFVGEPAYGIGRPAMNQGYNAKFSFQIEEEVEPTIVAAGASGVAHPIYCTSKSSFHTIAEENLAGTLVATDYKDPPIVNEPRYIVRRLTPTECARLQGFPDWWCDGLETENPTNEDISRWREIFETHADAMGKKTKPKSDNQIRKWLQSPHSDSAEYKMWGNGVALPNVVFVLSGIAYYAQKEAE